MVRCNRDGFAFNTIYIFCWSTLGCYYSSLISFRWQEHQIYTGELLNTSFSNFFSVFSNINIFHSYFKDICAVFIYKGLVLFLLCWGSQNEKGISSWSSYTGTLNYTTAPSFGEHVCIPFGEQGSIIFPVKNWKSYF